MAWVLVAVGVLVVAGIVWWSASSSESTADAIAESLNRDGDCLDTPSRM